MFNQMIVLSLLAASTLSVPPAGTPETPSNPEMTAIFDADQKARQDPAIDWAIVGPQDEARLKRTQTLLDAGALKSGDDFFNAAFVFQHGGSSDDYLKAHLLATIAVAKGKAGATWIAAATLDRYLQNTGKPQILGKQFRTEADGRTSQEPFNRSLASDALRGALGVPPLVAQEEQRKSLESATHRSPAIVSSRRRRLLRRHPRQGYSLPSCNRQLATRSPVQRRCSADLRYGGLSSAKSMERPKRHKPSLTWLVWHPQRGRWSSR